MYAEHFGLHRKPFQTPHDECSFFTSESVSAVIPSLLHAMRSDLGIAVVTGPAGVGKTATLRHLQRLLAADGKSLLLTSGAMQSTNGLFASLYRGISAGVDDAGIAASATTSNVERWQVIDRLRQLSQFWGPFLLLIDDAHNLPAEVFHELRSLLEEEHAGHSLLRLLIGGSLHLEEVLAKPGLTGFGQKIRTHVFLESLRPAEAVEFLTTQLSNVGGRLPDIMEPSAVERIVVAADGYPRLLCLLADEALIIAAAQSLTRVCLKTVDEALGRLQHLPYAWNATPQRHECSDKDRIDPDHIQDEEDVSCNTDGVIEFGAPSEKSHNQASDGVIEIGAPAELRDANAGSEVTDEVTDHDLSEEHFTPSLTDGINCSDADPAEEFPSETYSSEAVSREFEIEHVGDVAHSGSLIPSAVASDPEESESGGEATTTLQTDAAVDEHESFTEETQQNSTEEFELWQPPGEWQQIQTPATESNTHWYQRPLSADATAVFDRYTWNELGRVVPAGGTNPSILISGIKEKVVWPARQHGIVPDDSISVEYVDHLDETLPLEVQDSCDEHDHGLPDEANETGIRPAVGSTSVPPPTGHAQTDRLKESHSWVDGQLLGDEYRKEDSRVQQNTVPDPDSMEVVSLPISIDSVSDDDNSEARYEPHTSHPAQKPNSHPAGKAEHFCVSDESLFTLPISVEDVKAQASAANRPSRPTAADERMADDLRDPGQPEPIVQATESRSSGFAAKSRIDSVDDESNAGAVYAPRLLLLARARVGVTAARQLKTAAGAENLTATDASEQTAASTATQPEQSLRSQVVCGRDGKSAVPLDLLFTKLRQLRQE